MANSKHAEIDQQVTSKWDNIGNDVIKAVNSRYRNIVFVRTGLLSRYWVQLTIVYNPKTDSQLREIDKRMSINEFMGADTVKLVRTICLAFEQMGT